MNMLPMCIDFAEEVTEQSSVIMQLNSTDVQINSNCGAPKKAPTRHVHEWLKRRHEKGSACQVGAARLTM